VTEATQASDLSHRRATKAAQSADQPRERRGGLSALTATLTA
jgi:hypothetical protein